MSAVEPPSMGWTPNQLLVAAVFAVLIAFPDKVVAVLKGYDSVFFWMWVVFCLVASGIGTKIVVRIAGEGGELPANDEMFNFPEPVAVSQENPQAVAQRTASDAHENRYAATSRGVRR